MPEYKPIGELLISKGKLTQEQLETALLQRHGQRRRLGDVLVSLNYVSEQDIAECLGSQYEIDTVDPLANRPEPEALALVDSSFAVENRVLPMRCYDETLECAIADPIDVATIDMMSRNVGRHLLLKIAPMSVLLEGIRVAYGIDKIDRRASRSPVIKRSAKPKSERESLIDLVFAAADQPIHGSR